MKFTQREHPVHLQRNHALDSHRDLWKGCLAHHHIRHHDPYRALRVLALFTPKGNCVGNKKRDGR